jgi:PadR family transcriptional regulator PadR
VAAKTPPEAPAHFTATKGFFSEVQRYRDGCGPLLSRLILRSLKVRGIGVLMSATKRTNPDFLNGVPELLLLRLLARKPMYGYELVQNIKLQSQAAIEFGEGCIYPILHRLERAGLLGSLREQVGGRSRVMYHLTPAGARRLQESVSTWHRIVEAVKLILEGDSHVEPSHA